MISEVFTKSRAIMSAAALSFFAAVNPAQAKQQAVTFEDYCSAQQQQGANIAEVHRDMHPFLNDGNVTVRLQSTVHGPITMPFNCGALITYCVANKFVFTGAAMQIIHAGLGGYNQNDPANARGVMSRLAGNFNVYNSLNPDAVAAEEHIEGVHGMDILGVQNGTVVRAPNGNTIVTACAAQLNR
jgi:hypothetical protein